MLPPQFSRYSTGGATSCSNCNAGNSCANGIQTPCTDGTYQPSASSSSCLQCTAGSYCASGASAVTLCPDGLISLAGASSAAGCTSCPAGSFCVSGVKYTCTAGNYQPSQGQTKCISCVAGSYCPAAASVLTPCPDGTSSVASAMSVSDCFTCASGQVCTGGVQKVCDAGSYALAGQTTCTACPAGSYCPQGASAPTSCPDGKTSSVSATAVGSCYDCPVGNYCVNGNKIACAAGSYNSVGGKNSCSACPAGFYCAKECVTPTVCPDGSYSLSSQGICTSCAAGFSCTGNIFIFTFFFFFKKNIFIIHYFLDLF